MNIITFVKTAALAAGLVLSAGAAQAQNAKAARSRHATSELRQDRRDLKRDRAQLRAAVKNGNTSAAQRERLEIRKDKRDLRRDRRANHR